MCYIIRECIYDYQEFILNNLVLKNHFEDIRKYYEQGYHKFDLILRRKIRTKLLDICSPEERHYIRHLYFGRNYGDDKNERCGYEISDWLVLDR